jgi:biotin synthase
MRWSVASCARRAERGEALGREDALRLLAAARDDPWPVWRAADRVRRRFHGRAVHLCSIAAVKVGRCGEDCRWCAQSGHWPTAVEPHALLPTEEVVRAAEAAEANGAGHFGLVSSGGALSDDEFDAVLDAGRAVRRRTRLEVCGSLGALTPDRARRLVEAGFSRYNHNLETSARHFPTVCTTHTWADRVRTARLARDAGLALCCGGLFGIGETDADRVDLALALRDLEPAAVPINTLHPIPGTPLAGAEPVAPVEILSLAAVFRLLLPRQTVSMAGGRERNLRDLQCLMFAAGVDGCLIGHYLTTRGRRPEEDLAMIRDLGLRPAGATVPCGTDHG